MQRGAHVEGRRALRLLQQIGSFVEVKGGRQGRNLLVASAHDDNAHRQHRDRDEQRHPPWAWVHTSIVSYRVRPYRLLSVPRSSSMGRGHRRFTIIATPYTNAPMPTGNRNCADRQ